MNSVFIPNKKGWYSGAVFDTYTLAVNTATPATITWFADAVNTNSKLIQDTNMDRPSELIGGEELIIQSVRIVCIGMLNADIKALFKNYRFQLLVGNGLQYGEGGAEYFPGGAGIYKQAAGSGSGAGVEVEDVNLNGVPDPRAVNVINPGQEIHITSGIKFNVVAQGSTFTTVNTAGFGLKIRIYLDGQRYRPAQG